MLSLPAGVAAFSGNPAAVIPAIALVFIACLMSAYGFVLIADACRWTGETTYGGAWAKAVSPKTSWLATSACLAKAFIGCVSYSMILGDCISLVLAPAGLPLVSTRSGAMLGITVLALLPLCCLKSLAPMAKFSLLGTLSNVYCCGFILLRCFDGSYKTGGAMLAAAPAAPHFSSAGTSAARY